MIGACGKVCDFCFVQIEDDFCASCQLNKSNEDDEDHEEYEGEEYGYGIIVPDYSNDN
jgi:hypothetical protein